MFESFLGLWLLFSGTQVESRQVLKHFPGPRFPCIMIWSAPPWCKPWPKPTPDPWPRPFPSKYPLPSEVSWPSLKPLPTPFPCDTEDRKCKDPSPIPFPSVNPCPHDEFRMPCVIDPPIIMPNPSIVPDPEPTEVPRPTLHPCDGDPRMMHLCVIKIDPPIEEVPVNSTEPQLIPPPGYTVEMPQLGIEAY